MHTTVKTTDTSDIIERISDGKSDNAVKRIHCHLLPGKFVLRCYRRKINFTWVPPLDVGLKRALVKYKSHHEAKYTAMSTFGLGHSLVRVQNYTLGHLQPYTVYEFGLNLISANGTFTTFANNGSEHICACRTLADVPEKPSELRYHYLESQNYMLEWAPIDDNGERITDYDLRVRPLRSVKDGIEDTWNRLETFNMTGTSLRFSIKAQEQSEVELRAVNKVGPGIPAYLELKPPVGTVSGPMSSLNPLFGSLNHASGVLTYSLLSAGLCLFILLMFSLFIYRKRRKNGKSSRHPFLFGCHPSGRLHSGSGNDSFGLGGGGSDLTTSGVPLDLSTMEPLWNQEVNSLYGMGKSDLISFEQVNQISAANIRFERYIGCGAFGKVWEGWYHMNEKDGDRFEKVALKVRNSKSLSEAEFRREATLMHRYQHAHIVRFFGVSFDSPGQQCLVLEMMDQGNLRDYLHKARPRLAPNVAANMFAAAAICAAGESNSVGLGSEGSSSLNTSTTSTAAGPGGSNTASATASNVITLAAQLDIPALISIMKDIAHGCRYLEEQHFVHRDIAARNCLVSHNHPSGRIVKLCDFGLARDIYKNDCYQKRNEPKLPVRWMSPEAIRDGLFTTKSDVWAFSVTCWEVMTLGADPFYGRANLDVMNLVIGGHVLGRPENCPEDLYNQMLQCWSRFTEMRPSFQDLVRKMDEFVQLSQNNESPFSGPFIVSLPLPKSLPDTSGQPLFMCTTNDPVHNRYASNTMHRETLQQRCQRRPSLNEYRSFGTPKVNHPYRQQSLLLMDRSFHMTSTLPNKQNHQQQNPNTTFECSDFDKGYLVGPNAPNNRQRGVQSTEEQQWKKYIHTNDLATNERLVSDPLHRQSSFSNHDRRSYANNMKHENRLKDDQINAFPHGDSGNATLRLKAHGLGDFGSVQYNNCNTTNSLKFGQSPINYWLLGTGNGVDSLGYERPSWNGQLTRGQFERSTSVRTTSNGSSLDTIRRFDAGPTVDTTPSG